MKTPKKGVTFYVDPMFKLSVWYKGRRKIPLATATQDQLKLLFEQGTKGVKQKDESTGK